MTPFGRLAAGYVEAGWLLVAVIAALLFQVVSIRSFDFPRVMLLLQITPFLIGAAIVALAIGALGGRTETKSASLVTSLPRILPFAVGALVILSFGISTALSISPSISFWGSRFNSEGLAAAFGYACLMMLVALFLRRPEQARRLVDVILLASVPVALYGVAQYYGVDPLAAAMSVQLAGGRVVATLGNPILAGGYAAIVMPLTLARLIDVGMRNFGRPHPGPLPKGEGNTDPKADGPAVFWRVLLTVGVVIGLQGGALGLFLWTAARYSQLWWIAAIPLVAFFLAALVVPRAAPTGVWGSRLAIAGYGALLLLQLYLFYLADSRGPFVAAPIALGVTLFLLFRDRRVRLALGALGLAVALLVLTIVVVPAVVRSVPELASNPVVGGLAQFGRSGNTVISRWLIWQGVIYLALGQHDVGIPSDPLTPIRPIFGYGPETLAMAYEKVVTAEAREWESYRISRAHSEPFDALSTRGLFGLATYLAVLAALAFAAIRADRLPGVARPILAGSVGAVTAYTISQLFEPNDPSLSLHFWLLGGVVLSRLVQTGAEVDAAAILQPLPQSGQSRRSRRTPVPALVARPPSLTARRWAVGSAILAGGLILGMIAALGGAFDLLGWLLIAWLAITLAGIAWAFLSEGTSPGRAELGRAALIGGPLAAIAFLIATVPYQRFQADAFSKYGLEAARRGDLPSALALGRSALILASDDELFYSNLARSLAAAANGAPDRPVRPDYRPTLGLLHGMPVTQLSTLSKREILLLTATVLEQAVKIAPIEPDNRLNLAIVHRALGDLGEKGHYDTAREHLETLTRISPTQAVYRQQLAAMAGKVG